MPAIPKIYLLRGPVEHSASDLDPMLSAYMVTSGFAALTKRMSLSPLGFRTVSSTD